MKLAIDFRELRNRVVRKIKLRKEKKKTLMLVGWWTHISQINFNYRNLCSYRFLLLLLKVFINTLKTVGNWLQATLDTETFEKMRRTLNLKFEISVSVSVFIQRAHIRRLTQSEAQILNRT